MPVYEYRCFTCNDVFDRFFPSFQQAADAELTCPICAGKDVKRLISAPMFRGSDMGDDEDFSSHEDVSSPPKRVLMGRKELEARAKK
ncbi:hypothetical protein U14_04365 [Candidatus Moduliflexus flocculans]|uniref:Putative regulatory protein FmdB zinc ribbon domain-containing protein n=1 Tax=Candidatus Moduliflexus flocculans TaxID=1499966 RepID=A0A0S6W4K7_9BACT|nr:hypothetical protein U14_04365 [Candidatus Moduliflexus flocculans]